MSIFKEKTGHIITECARASHHRMISWKEPHRILYVGTDHALSKFLREELKPLDCMIVRCPTGSVSRTLIESKINYSLLLLDEKLPDMMGAELEHFARSLEHRKKMPIMIFKRSDDLGLLVKNVADLLAKSTR